MDGFPAAPAARAVLVAVVLGCAALFSGCAPQAVATPINGPVICNTVAVPSVQLAYPENGATGVPRSTASVLVIVSGSVNAPDTYGLAFTVTSTSGTPAVSSAPATSAPSPLPTPIATLPPVSAGEQPSQTYAAIPLAPLAANTTYSVTRTYLAGVLSSGPCAIAPATLGAFTTGG